MLCQGNHKLRNKIYTTLEQILKRMLWSNGNLRQEFYIPFPWCYPFFCWLKYFIKSRPSVFSLLTYVLFIKLDLFFCMIRNHFLLMDWFCNTMQYNLYIVAEVVYKKDHWRTWKRKRKWHAGFKSDQLVTMVKWYTEQQTPLPL